MTKLNEDYIVKKFLEIFDGYEFAYGQHGKFQTSSSGKVNGQAKTITSKLTKDIVLRHLKGNGDGLGIVPLKANNSVRFGVIDIDIKHPTNPLVHTIQEIEEKVNKLNLPLVVCQSKSKGVHLYCFSKDEIPAELMMSKLKKWSSFLGYGNCEIFPKQSSRLDKNDIGNWINLPYYNYENTDRYCLVKGEKVSIKGFFENVDVYKLSSEEIEKFTVELENLNQDYNDAPPCLQILMQNGVSEGGRNNGLYNFAVYLKQKYPDSYDQKIQEINVTKIKPSLDHHEVSSIINSVSKKDLFYKCNESPIIDFCNKEECKKRRFGVGNHVGNNIEIDNITKYESNDGSVRWYFECQGRRIKSSNEEMLNQRSLIPKLMGATNKIYIPMKDIKWVEYLNKKLESCQVFQDPEDATPKGLFRAHFDSFLTECPSGRKKEDLLKYNNYLDEDNNLIYFTAKNLVRYLKNMGFSVGEKEMKDIWHWLKDEFNAQSKPVRINNTKTIRCWVVTAPSFYNANDLKI